MFIDAFKLLESLSLEKKESHCMIFKMISLHVTGVSKYLPT